MAGMTMNRAGAQGPPGMVYDPRLGGYVSQAQSGTPQQAATADAYAHPTTRVNGMGGQDISYDGTNWQEVRDVRDPTPSEGGPRAPAAPRPAATPTAPVEDPARAAAYNALAAQIQNMTGYTAPPIPAATPPAPTPATSSYDPAADAATYGRAKERTGLALQSAMRGLRGAMASRGITGSGIEARATSDLFGQGLGQLAETDRSLAENTAGRAFTANESAAGRTQQNNALIEQQRQATMGEEGRRAQLANDANARRLSMLLQTYSQQY